jgi:hypothetical protein
VQLICNSASEPLSPDSTTAGGRSVSPKLGALTRAGLPHLPSTGVRSPPTPPPLPSSLTSPSCAFNRATVRRTLDAPAGRRRGRIRPASHIPYLQHTRLGCPRYSPVPYGSGACPRGGRRPVPPDAQPVPPRGGRPALLR